MKSSGIHPLEKIFFYYKTKSKVEILERDSNIRHSGFIIGFDEYMNLVFKTTDRHFLIKGDCISCVLLRK
ncbi:small nuclear ribonucleoprotein E [Pancytospora epiphaga]|nr:small nuclear ribonucleoprotein E [Pancytospora epiphaga]